MRRELVFRNLRHPQRNQLTHPAFQALSGNQTSEIGDRLASHRETAPTWISAIPISNSTVTALAESRFPGRYHFLQINEPRLIHVSTLPSRRRNVQESSF